MFRALLHLTTVQKEHSDRYPLLECSRGGMDTYAMHHDFASMHPKVDIIISRDRNAIKYEKML